MSNDSERKKIRWLPMFRNKEELPLLDGSGEQNIQDLAVQTPRKSAAREWIESLVFSLIFVFFFTTFIAQATQVPTESMKPTILVGDHFFLDKFAFPANYPIHDKGATDTPHYSWRNRGLQISRESKNPFHQESHRTSE
jgi:hypothetical protein